MCDPFCLRTDGLTGADPGGTWEDVNSTHTGTLVGDDPCVNWADLSPGDNLFRYCLAGCGGGEVCADVTIYKMDIGQVGTNQSITLCEDDDPVNVFNALAITLGPDGIGAWTGDTGNAGWTEPNFDPSLSGVGTFTYTYTITPDLPGGYTDLGCCSPISVTMTITVTNTANAGSGGNVAGC